MIEKSRPINLSFPCTVEEETKKQRKEGEVGDGRPEVELPTTLSASPYQGRSLHEEEDQMRR